MKTSRAGVSSPDQGQKQAFLNELSQFLSDKGRFLCRTPNLCGRIIDLHDLYNKVTSAGGYQKATERGYWEDFLDVYGYPGVSSTLAYGLQRIYQLYLEDYERVHYFGDDEPQPFYRSLPRGGYRRYRYTISEMQRMQANMNMLKPSVSDYDRVVLSLESCLPNEIDFAVNACTLLSGESRHVLRLPQCRRIVDALLMHAGIIADGHDSYREVLEELQRKTKHNYIKFWNNSIAKKAVLPILLPLHNKVSESTEPDTTSRNLESSESPDLEIGLSSSSDFTEALQERLKDIEPKDCDERTSDFDNQVIKKSKWSELFHGHRSLGVEDYEGQRVLQIALVLLNLSFEDFNVTLLARHPSLIRFVFLCTHSEYSCLRQTGLDILGNISSHMQLLHLQYDIMSMIFDTINLAVLSPDKFERIRGFEILGNICRRRPNVDHICVSVRDEVYDAAVQNLMISDVEILLAAIEALYRLSKLGETTCTRIIFIKGCIDILMCLVTLNVRTFGQQKLAEIRLARKILPGQPERQQQPTPVYHSPVQLTVPQPTHTAIIQRQMHLQQQAKLGSAHQAQPTFAPAAAIVSQSAPVLATARIKLPLPPQPQPVNPPLKIQPSVEPTPTPPPAPQVSVKQHQPTLPHQPQVFPPQQLPQPPPKVQQVPPPAISPPPPSTAPPGNVGSSPPGAGPTYTHSETGTVPPVFHYMPAPPTEIVQDSSPESFTKLWIWATYEAQSESYIPRVDVYCEYLASSNRYGRQGKTEILSATDFGKCLKQIFPLASSRLFNQGRGQPQYHIAGIKKRATPLPVPGHQLKDSHSVFSSDTDSDQVAVTRQQPAVAVTSRSRPAASATPRPNLSSPVSTAVPIQQLQFQPILIVSAVPGTNNVALVPGAQLTAASSILTMASQTAVAIQQPQAQVVNVTSAQATTLDSQNLFDNVQHPQFLVSNATIVTPTQAMVVGGQVLAHATIPKQPDTDSGDDHSLRVNAQQIQGSTSSTGATSMPVWAGFQTSDQTGRTGDQPQAQLTSTEEVRAQTTESVISSRTVCENVSQVFKPDSMASTPATTGVASTPVVTAINTEAEPANTVAVVNQKVRVCEKTPRMHVNLDNSGKINVDQSSVLSVASNNLPNQSEAVEKVTQQPAVVQSSDSSTCEQSSNVNMKCTESTNQLSKSIVGPSREPSEDRMVDPSPNLALVASPEQKPLGNGLESCSVLNEFKSDDCNQADSPVINGYMEVDAPGDSSVPDKPVKRTKHKSSEKEIDKPPRKRRRTKSKDTKQMVNGITAGKCTPNTNAEEQRPIKNNGLHDGNLNKNVPDIINGETETEAAVNSILDPSDTSVDEIMRMDISDVIKTPQKDLHSQVLEPELSHIRNELKDCESSSTLDEAQTYSKAETIESNKPIASESSRDNSQHLNEPVASSSTSDTSHLVNKPVASDSRMPQNDATATAVPPILNTPVCVSMTLTSQTITPGSQIPVTPTNPIPHSDLNQRLKDTITRRKNSQLVTPTTSASTPTNSLPPSVIQQYSYKADGQSLSQKIIPITPQQLQQQYHLQRQVPSLNNHSEQLYHGTSQAGSQRPTVQVPGGPPMKVHCPTQPIFTANPSYTPQYHPSTTPRLPVPVVPHRPPLPQISQKLHMPPMPITPMASNNPPHPGTQPKSKPPTIDLMAPNASLLVLYRNVGKIPFANHMDEKEDAISKSVRLTASLILTNIARYSNLGRSLLQKHEDNLARVAMSQMDCSPIVARLLGELDV